MRICLIFLLILLPHSLSTQEKPFLLILGFDGLSYQLTQHMYDSGMYRNFQRPIPIVASFPSISDPNWARLMKAPLEKSYTKAHFENSLNQDGSYGKEVGNIINHLTAPPQYEKAFDFRPEGLVEHLMSVTWSNTSALFWMKTLSRILLEKKMYDESGRPRDDYRAFIMNTDIISHVGGKKEMIEYFKKVDKKLSKLQKDFERKFNRKLEIMILSDHGNYYTTPQSIDFAKPLKEKKWEHVSNIKAQNEYAFVAPEIISFGAFYTLKGQEEIFAKDFSKINGVHVSLVNIGNNKIKVFSSQGCSLITVDPLKNTIQYNVLEGIDPFNHIHLFKNTASLDMKDYFYKTLQDDYPNALVNAWEAFYKNSQHPASVLVSPKLGYVFTNLTLEILTALSGVKSTHGSFHKEEALGVFMTTLKPKEEALQVDGFFDLLKSHGYRINTVFNSENKIANQ